MKYDIIIQRVTNHEFVPSAATLRRYAQAALKKVNATPTEVTIRIVGVDEMTHLNSTYRNQDKPTNVLSFPAELPVTILQEHPILGDIVICAEVVNREAKEQQKSNDAHWAHMVIHGICHLLGYDHEKEEDALIMEKLETNIMQTLDFENPYETGVE